MLQRERKVNAGREQKITSPTPGLVQRPQGARSKRPPDTLTPREHEILQLVWAGLTNRAITQQLQISSKTGEAHRANMMRKLGVSNIAQLLNRAVQKGLLVHSNASGDFSSPVSKDKPCTGDDNSPGVPDVLRGSRQRRQTT